MALTQEPEIQFAQRLASNEKPIRTKALKKLRKYINVRSQKGGFTSEELLKLWKGLFYCLWMQDKPLLQEELSNQISTLIHSFQHINGQMLYLESFLQTFKREWNGIDRLRMDKFFQLVRLMFRRTFELVKRKNWDSSVVEMFLELLAAQLMKSGSEAPSGLQFHILDLYMTELANVGSAELTAEQNLVFIEPFCKTAAKTKDRVLFSAICRSIFSTIINQAPFAIEDLMNEMKALENSNSERAVEEDDDGDLKQKKSKQLSQEGKQVNGFKSKDQDDDYLKDSETELPYDDEFGPVLQFDYAALADKLFKLASQSSTPSNNRQKLYRIIKVLRDLSEGIFPHDEYPEEVSTDEDDEMFGSRKRIKRVAANTEELWEGNQSAKKSKRKKKETFSMSKQNNHFKKDEDEDEEADLSTNVQKKKRKKMEETSDRGQTEALTQVYSSVEEASVSKKKKMKRLRAELHKNVETQITPVSFEASQEETTTPVKKKKKGKGKAEKNGLSSEVVVEADVTSEVRQHTTAIPLHKNSKKNVNQENVFQLSKKNRKMKREDNKIGAEVETPKENGAEELQCEKTKLQKKKKKFSQSSIFRDKIQTVGSVESKSDGVLTARKISKKKRKIPVTFEYESDELKEAKKMDCDSKNNLENRGQTPTLESKKVTFGLKNNKTAEFRKTDRSLLVSPVGSSRVPFDPKQKPKFGVLKSPPTPFPKRKTSLNKSKSTPKRRPSAADFF